MNVSRRRGEWCLAIRETPARDAHTSGPNDIVIAVMGITRSGKTTFIQRFCEEDLNVGHGLKSTYARRLGSGSKQSHACRSSSEELLNSPGHVDEAWTQIKRHFTGTGNVDVVPCATRNGKKIFLIDTPGFE
jgi:signal recognition particle receptor subunit beta